MMNTNNPLISEDHQETVANAAEALDAIMALLADSQDPARRGMFLLLQPISHALTHVAAATTD